MAKEKVEKSVPFSKTKVLVQTYGAKIKSNEITDEEILALTSNNTFKASSGFVDLTKPISEKNHTQGQAMINFVVAVAADMDPTALHPSVSKIIPLYFTLP